MRSSRRPRQATGSSWSVSCCASGPSTSSSAAVSRPESWAGRSPSPRSGPRPRRPGTGGGAPRGLRLYPAGGEPLTVPVESTDPWGPEIAYFLECVEQGRQPEQGTGEQAREALALSLAAARSLESGRPEDV